MAAQAVGLAAAINYLTDVDMRAVREHETELVGYALDRLQELPGVHIVGPSTSDSRGGAGPSPSTICTPTMSARCYVYNTRSDVDVLVAGIRHAQSIFR